MNLKTIGVAAALAVVLSPLATQAQTAPVNAAKPLVKTAFSSPLKIIGFDGHITVTPRGASTAWTCAEGVPTEIDAGSPPSVVYTISPDGNMILANANGAALKVDVAKSQFAIAATADAADSAKMRDFTSLGAGTTMVVGTSPTSTTTGFELLYAAASGLTVTVKTGTQTLGVFTVSGTKWQIGIFPLDEAESPDAAGASPAPRAKGDVSVIGSACKASPIPDTSVAK